LINKKEIFQSRYEFGYSHLSKKNKMKMTQNKRLLKKLLKKQNTSKNRTLYLKTEKHYIMNYKR